MAKMDWNGDAIEAKYMTAARLGVDQTTGAAANYAKSHHEFENRTAVLEGSLRMQPAELDGLRIIGRWGSFEVIYAIFQELMAGETAGSVHRTQEGGHPYLRPAGDATYPDLPRNIRNNLAALP